MALIHICNKEAEIAKIAVTVEDLDHIVKGNGQEGLLSVVTKLSVNIKNLDDTSRDLRTVVSGLNQFVEGEKATTAQRRWLSALTPSIISLVFMLGMFLWGSGVLKKEVADIGRPKVERIGDKTYIIMRGTVTPVDSSYWDKDYESETTIQEDIKDIKEQVQENAELIKNK